MSLDPVLARHINVPRPKPQSASRPIPSSISYSSPARSQTLSHPNSYSLSDLISLSPSSPSLNLHPPPVPTTASKIESVNRVLRQDSQEFLKGLVIQGKLSPASPELDSFTNKERSRTMPIPIPPAVKIKSNTLLPLNGDYTDLIQLEQHSNGEKEKKGLQAVELDFEIDSTLSPIDIELKSARHPPPSTPVPLTPRTGTGMGGAVKIFNNPMGSARVEGSHVNSPSPLSLTIAQSLSKRHDGLRSAHFGGLSSSSHDKIPRSIPISARSPSIQSITIVSSPIEDSPWRKNSINTNSAPIRKITPGNSLNAFAAPFPLPKTTPHQSDKSHQPQVARAESSTLPLPPSLPRKPTTILPPVFVKRESAMLPQTMALPDIPPMGDEWVGERSLSGNEKRRRATGMLTPAPLPVRSSGGWSEGNGGAGGSAGSAPASRRPQRLVSLGEKLKENINRPVV